MFRTLFQDYVTFYKKKPYCSICRLYFNEWLDAANHISKEDHLTSKNRIAISPSSEALKELTLQNYVEYTYNGITLEKISFHCLYCKCDIKTHKKASKHIKRKSHELMIPKCEENLDEIFDVDDDSLVSLKSNAELFSEVSEVLSSTSEQSNDNSTVSERNGEMASDKNVNDKTLNNTYLCEFCNLQIDAKDLFAHVKEETHLSFVKKINIDTKFACKEDILFTCILCQYLVDTPQQLCEHSSLPLHIQKEQDILKENSSIPKDRRSTALPIYNLIQKENNASSYTEISFLFLDTVSMKALRNKNIQNSFHCTCCNKRLPNRVKLVIHLKRKKHFVSLKIIDDQKDLSAANSQETLNVVEKLHYRCNLCKCEVKGNFFKHCIKRSHKKIFHQSLIGKKLTPYEFSTNAIFICIPCRMLIQGCEPFNEHFLNKDHEINTVAFLESYIDKNSADVEHVNELCQIEKLAICTLPHFINDSFDIVEQPFIYLNVSTDDNITDVLSKENFEKKTFQFSCHLCDEVSSDINALYQHLLGKKHSCMLVKHTMCMQPSSILLVAHGISLYNEKFYCDMCSQTVVNEISLVLHIISPKHIEQRNKISKDTSVVMSKTKCKLLVNNGIILRKTIMTCLYCKCDIPTIDSVSAHIKENVHIQNVQKVLGITNENFITGISTDRINAKKTEKSKNSKVEKVYTKEVQGILSQLNENEEINIIISKTLTTDANTSENAESSVSNDLQNNVHKTDSVIQINHLLFDSKGYENIELMGDVAFSCALCQHILQNVEELNNHLTTLGHGMNEFLFLNKSSKEYKEAHINVENLTKRYKILISSRLCSSLLKRDNLQIIELPYLYVDVIVKKKSEREEQYNSTYRCVLCNACKLTKMNMIKHLSKKKHIDRLNISVPMGVPGTDSSNFAAHQYNWNYTEMQKNQTVEFVNADIYNNKVKPHKYVFNYIEEEEDLKRQEIIDYSNENDKLSDTEKDGTFEYSKISSKLFLENYVSYYTGKLYCILCQLFLPDQYKAADHIFDIKHILLRDDIITPESVETLKSMTEEDSVLIVNNGIILNKKTLMCLYCTCSLPSSGHVPDHIKGKYHVRKVQEAPIQLNKNGKMNTDISRIFEVNAIIRENVKSSVSNNFQDNVYETDSVIENTHLLFDSKGNQKIEVMEDVLFNCALCQCVLQSPEDLSEHLVTLEHSKREHEFLNENTDKYKKEQKDTGNLKENGILNGSPLCNTLLRRRDNLQTVEIPYLYLHVISEKYSEVNEGEYCLSYSCLLCFTCSISQKQLLMHLHRKKHTERLNDISLPLKVSTRFDDRETVTYKCEICDTEIDRDNVLKHINTNMHKKNVEVLRKDDIDLGALYDDILYDCIPCKRIIQGNKLFIEHLLDKIHDINTFDVFRKYILKELTDWQSIGRVYKDRKSYPLCNLIYAENGHSSIGVTKHPFIQIELLGIAPVEHLNQRQADHCKYKYTCSFCRFDSFCILDFTSHIEGQGHFKAIKVVGKISANQLPYNVTESKVVKTINPPNMFAKAQNYTSLEPVSSYTNHAKNTVNWQAMPKRSIYNEIMQQLNMRPARKVQMKESAKKINYNLRYMRSYFQFEETMYKCKEEILEAMKLSYENSVFDPKKRNVYCIICQKDIACAKKFYEHVRSEDHLQKLKINMTTYTKQLIKKLPQVEVPVTSPTTISPTKTLAKAICYACNKEINENEIEHHIKDYLHVKNYKHRNNIAMQKYEWIVSRLNSCWYNIQMYSCVLCNERFDQKIRFLEHLSKNHANSVNGTYDFCTWCGTLWLGNPNTFEIHCNSIEHRYIVSNDEFEPRDVSDRLKQFILDHEKISDALLQSACVVSDSTYIYEELRTSIRSNLESLFDIPICDIHFFGSRFSGVGLPNSDIDIFVDFGTYYENHIDSHIPDMLEKVAKQLATDRTAWDVLDVIHEARTPIITLFYRKMRVECDISFKNGLAVENTKLIRCYTMKYPNCRKLILYIKKWWILCSITGIDQISSYAFALCVIFYLQQRGLVCSVMDLMKQQNITQRISGWKVCSDLEKVDVIVDHSDVPFVDLLLGFFDYFTEFDYRYNVISPCTGEVLKKEMFAYPENLPGEINTLYMPYIQTKADPDYFRIDSAFCVQDPYDLTYNVTRAVQPLCIRYFRHFCKESAAILRKAKS